MALPKSGCSATSKNGTLTMTRDGTISTSVAGASRFPARWRASIRMVASFAASTG